MSEQSLNLRLVGPRSRGQAMICRRWWNQIGRTSAAATTWANRFPTTDLFHGRPPARKNTRSVLACPPEARSLARRYHRGSTIGTRCLCPPALGRPAPGRAAPLLRGPLNPAPQISHRHGEPTTMLRSRSPSILGQALLRSADGHARFSLAHTPRPSTRPHTASSTSPRHPRPFARPGALRPVHLHSAARAVHLPRAGSMLRRHVCPFFVVPAMIRAWSADGVGTTPNEWRQTRWTLVPWATPRLCRNTPGVWRFADYAFRRVLQEARHCGLSVLRSSSGDQPLLRDQPPHATGSGDAR